MDFGKIFKDSLVFPSKNWKIFVVLGVILVFSELFTNFDTSFLGSGTLTIGGFILLVISVVATFISQGYYLSIIRGTVNFSDELPSLELAKNFGDGFKLLIVNVVYLLPSFIILFVLGYFLRFFELFATIMPVVNRFGADYVNHLPQDLLFNFLISFLILMILGAVLLFISFLFLYIARARLAKYDSIDSALQIKEVLNDISKITWGNYILWMIIITIVLFILYIVYTIFYSIGIIGLILSSFLIGNYIQMFFSRNLGLIYRETEVDN